jgi:hypothetical protein
MRGAWVGVRESSAFPGRLHVPGRSLIECGYLRALSLAKTPSGGQAVDHQLNIIMASL